MAVTLSLDALRNALRLGDTDEETEEAARLLAYGTEAVTRHAPDAPAVVANEAVVRLAAYLFDQPTASRRDSHANAIRNSGAARMLLPYVIHRAGSADEAVQVARESGEPGNPVVDVTVSGDVLTVTYSDGSTREETLPAGTGAPLPMPATPAEAAGGTSTTIRSWTAALIRAAINAVVVPWARAGDPDPIPADKLGNAPAGGTGIDQAARDQAAAAATSANAAQATANLAEGAAARAQSNLDAHEATRHNYDETARDAAATAQNTGTNALSRAQAAQHQADEAGTAATAARGVADGAVTTIDAHVADTSLHRAITLVDALPGTPDSARLYGLRDAADQPAGGLFYEKQESGTTIRIRFDDLTRRSAFTTFRARGWAAADDTAVPPRFTAGGEVLPSRPAALSALVSYYDTAASEWYYLVELSGVTGPRLFLDVADAGGNHIQNLRLNREGTSDVFISAGAVADQFGVVFHDWREVRIRRANNTANASLIPLIPEVHTEQIADVRLVAEREADIREYARSLSGAAVPGRTVLFRDTGDYSRTDAQRIFRRLSLNRAPLPEHGLEITIVWTTRAVSYPISLGTAGDWLNLQPLDAAQLAGTLGGAEVPATNCLAFKTSAFSENTTDDFGHGSLYVGRISDTSMGVAIGQNRGRNLNFRMTVREVP